jgi:hypothetical protein
MWKEAAVAKFEAPFRYFLEGTEKNDEETGQQNRYRCEDLNLRSAEYEAGLLPF